jgi:hypothetical protein
MDAARARSLAERLRVVGSSDDRTLHFHGDSMRPFLQEGDGLVVRPVIWDEIRIGDIVAYRAAGRVPARRVVWKRAGHLVLWCENWPARRFRAARADVLGRVVAREREGSWLTHRQPRWRRATLCALARFCAWAPVNGAAWLWFRTRRRLRGPRRPGGIAPSR